MISDKWYLYWNLQGYLTLCPVTESTLYSWHFNMSPNITGVFILAQVSTIRILNNIKSGWVWTFHTYASPVAMETRHQTKNVNPPLHRQSLELWTKRYLTSEISCLPLWWAERLHAASRIFAWLRFLSESFRDTRIWNCKVSICSRKPCSLNSSECVR